MKTDARISVGVDGVSDVAGAARQVAQAWSSAGNVVGTAFRGAGRAISQQFSQVGQDMLRTATVMRALDLHSAVDGARSYREEISRLGVATGTPVGALRAGFKEISKATLESEPALAAWARGVGRVAYDYKGAVVGARALHDESVATGKSFDEMGNLGAVLMTSLNAGDEVAETLMRIRAQAEALGTVGGVSALQDQIASLATTMTGFASSSDSARSRITALTAVLGRGYSPAQATQVQQSLIGSISQNAAGTSYLLGRNILNERGEVDDPVSVLRDLRAFYRKVAPSKKLRMMMLQSRYGNLGAAALENADLSEEGVGALARAPRSDNAGAAARRFADSEAGRALSSQVTAQRSMRDMAERLVRTQDVFTDKFKDNPLAGQMVGGLMQATMRAAVDAVGSAAGSAFAGAGAGVGAGAGAAGEVGAVASLATGAGAATVALGTFAIGLVAAGKVLFDIGDASSKKQGLGAPSNLTEAEADEKRAAARNAVDAAGSHRSAGVKDAMELERSRLRGRRGRALVESYERAYESQTAPRIEPSLQAATTGPNADPALKELALELRAGRIDPARLPKALADEIVAALARSPLKAVVQVAGAPPQPAESN